MEAVPSQSPWPYLSTMPSYGHSSPQPRQMHNSNTQMVHPPNLGLGISFSSPAHQSGLLGRRTGPRRSAHIDLRRTPGALMPDPIVSPSELLRRDFPVTPGAPVQREFFQWNFPRTPDAPLIGSLPTEEGMHFYIPTGLITPMGLGIVLESSEYFADESEYED